MSHSGAVVCALCKKQLSAGDDPSLPVSHGICVSCAPELGAPVEDLSSAPPQLLDQLPFGVIRIAADGEVISYSQTEAGFSQLSPSTVIGKNFFNDIAPCTRVKQFAGELEGMRAEKRNARKELSFVFKFPHGSMLMSIVMLYDRYDDVAILLVKPLASAGREQPSRKQR